MSNFRSIKFAGAATALLALAPMPHKAHAQNPNSWVYAYPLYLPLIAQAQKDAAPNQQAQRQAQFTTEPKMSTQPTPASPSVAPPQTPLPQAFAVPQEPKQAQTISAQPSSDLSIGGILAGLGIAGLIGVWWVKDEKNLRRSEERTSALNRAYFINLGPIRPDSGPAMDQVSCKQRQNQRKKDEDNRAAKQMLGI